jgi:superfamily II DNA or RNA helicase
MIFASGSLVHARGREWVVLPETTDLITMLRPLGGTDAEVTGILNGLEEIRPASFPLPDPSDTGDFQSCKLLREALRLGFRSSAGPFRSFSQINVEPRPYQLVPLLVALKLDPVRVLIADDVGIGKTVEAMLIARELLDRAEITRMAILCPPHLAEQWQTEVARKFNINAELVLSSTVNRLTKDLALNESLFEVHPFTIVSTDFVKSERNRNDFLRDAPELIIVDEAHTCAYSGQGVKHQRHRLLKDLAADESRHIILVTATPHSGDENAFRSLLEILNPDFEILPDDLTGPDKEHHRRSLAAHFIQRRRGDIRRYLDEATPFPSRVDLEDSYRLAPEYERLFDRAFAYARETVADKEDDTRFRKRVRWWSVLALLRSLASSPAAAAATLRSRSAGLGIDDEQQMESFGQQTVFDLLDESAGVTEDVSPGTDWTEETEEGKRERARLLEMAREADKLKGNADAKLVKAVDLLKGLLKDGFSPIVFCRFIPTAEYLAEELRGRLGKSVTVDCVTGLLAPEDREARVMELEKANRGARVLVCTDCLSEGINLQNLFDAVFHYDLSWNPTRHEQRDGRVDRFGQKSAQVRSVTYYGIDNRIDGIVLDVLIKKHRKIRNSLGISVPIPTNSEQVVNAIFEGLLLRTGGRADDPDQQFFDFIKDFEPVKQRLHLNWDNVADREKVSQTMFAQRTIRPEEVAAELTETREAAGSIASAVEFLESALKASGATVTRNAALQIRFNQAPPEVIAATGLEDDGELSLAPDVLNRTHPAVQGLASQILSAALDPRLPKELRIAHRSGVIRTGDVSTRKTLLLCRLRFHIIRRSGEEESPMLVEDSLLAGFEGPPANPRWLDSENVQKLFALNPSGNVPADVAKTRIQEVLDSIDGLIRQLDGFVDAKAQSLLASHQRVRAASRTKGVSYEVIPHRPPDLLAVFQFLPPA